MGWPLSDRLLSVQTQMLIAFSSSSQQLMAIPTGQPLGPGTGSWLRGFIGVVLPVPSCLVKPTIVPAFTSKSKLSGFAAPEGVSRKTRCWDGLGPGFEVSFGEQETLSDKILQSAVIWVLLHL